MGLSEEEKKALEEHFRGRELYEPAKEKEQETADFSPCVCGGGCAPGMCHGGMGMAEGGGASLGLQKTQGYDLGGSVLGALSSLIPGLDANSMPDEDTPAGYITNNLASMLLMLATRYATRPIFMSYSYREDMVAEAMADLCKNALKFNAERRILFPGLRCTAPPALGTVES